jgi:Pyruvate/2-oxoacid:ferredoxin oxidoreductase gamma subunit
MNQPSLFTFQNRVAPRDHFHEFIHHTGPPEPDDVTIHEIPLAEIAAPSGQSRGQNIVMIGAFLRKTGILSPEAYLRALRNG